MRTTDSARLKARYDHGIELDCGDGSTCRILLPMPGVARVVFVPLAGFRERRSWMVCGEAGDTPWEGRDRLDAIGAPSAGVKLIESEDRLTLKSAEVTVEIGLAPLNLRWYRADGVLFAADRVSRAYGLAGTGPICCMRWRATRRIAITGSATRRERSTSRAAGCAPP